MRTDLWQVVLLLIAVISCVVLVMGIWAANPWLALAGGIVLVASAGILLHISPMPSKEPCSPHNGL